MAHSKVLATFSGKNGDILWSLPTAQAIAHREGIAVDFAIMPYYRDLLPLIQYQGYIENAYVIEDWMCQHSHFGDQPWQPPDRASNGYDKVFHLAYRNDPHHGNRKLSLIDFIADQQGIKLTSPVPFLATPDLHYTCSKEPYFAYGFNFNKYDEKMQFIKQASDKVGLKWIDVNKLPWLEASACIKGAIAFIGCRSANNVIAHGVGQPNIFMYEPDPGRLSEIFNCPYGPTEIIVPLANAVGIFQQKAEVWKAMQKEKFKPPRHISIGRRPLVGSINLDDYKDMTEAVTLAKDTIAILKDSKVKIEIPHEHRLWEYGTVIHAMLHKYDGKIPSTISVLDVGSGWSALGPILNYKYNCDVIEYEPDIKTYWDDRLSTSSFLKTSGRKGIYLHSFTLESMPGQDYDVVTCLSVLEHVKKDKERQCWKELAARVRKGGLLVITVDIVENAHAKYSFDEMRALPNYTLDDMRERVNMLIDECNMKVLGPEPEYVWNGSHVNDYTFFRLVMTKQ